MGLLQIAVLMTCHNRKDKTIECLDNLRSQIISEDIRLRLFLVDDGCSDGTADAVRERFPGAVLLSGNGSLFWCGGMRLAFAEAKKEDFDYYLWLNDDTLLFPGAVSALLQTLHSVKSERRGEHIIAGAIKDPATGASSYGGWVHKWKWKPLSLGLVGPSGKPRVCHAINGNCVLIPGDVANKVGNLSSCFTHGMGDFDYAFRARKMGIQCWLTPEYVGACPRNSDADTYRDSNLSIRERRKKMSRPTEIASASEWLRFTWRHGGPSWPIYWLAIFFRVFFPTVWLAVSSKKIHRA